MLLICFHRNNALEKGFYCRKKKDIFTLFSRVKLIGSEKERNKQTRRGEAKTKQFYEALNGIENQKLFFMLRN